MKEYNSLFDDNTALKKRGPRIIGIAGPAGAGKDAFAGMLREFMPQYLYNEQTSMAYPVKQALIAIFGEESRKHFYDDKNSILEPNSPVI